MTKAQQIAVAHARTRLSQAASQADDARFSLENAGLHDLAMQAAHARNAAQEAGRALTAGE